MTQDNPNRYRLQPEDAQRLNRLSEEIRGRLAEIAFIISRITGSEYKGGVTKFIPREGMQAQMASGEILELVEIIPGLVCCYGSVHGETILECPCGKGMA